VGSWYLHCCKQGPAKPLLAPRGMAAKPQKCDLALREKTSGRRSISSTDFSNFPDEKTTKKNRDFETSATLRKMSNETAWWEGFAYFL